MDQELFAHLEESRQEMKEQVGGLRGEVGGLREESRQRFERMEGQIEGLREGVRHTQILVEDMRGEIRLLAEGMMGFDHTTKTSLIEVHRKLDDLTTLVTPLYRRIDERVSHLEAREGEKARDVMELIRERYGMPEVR
ncbi:MAG TPA: hypothetical protein VEW48_20545 [Thermoanaerobaculia bacterium]|nr:hypothetical protein [Thermoanaerobaculia bacterium]